MRNVWVYGFFGVAVHDAAAKTLRLKPVSEGTLITVR
jgi:hypothetical protein